MNTEPLNYEGPLPADVVQRVSDFLLKPVRNESGGWTDVSKEDWEEVWGIFEDILDAKFERDPDGDHTIEFQLCHRQNGMMQVIHVPYNMDTDADVEKALHAITMASVIIEQMTRSLTFNVQERRRADARKRKMQPVINFLASNGHIRAHDRVKDFVEGDNSSGLFVGKDDTVWSPLGLSCAELRDLIHDRIGKATMREDIEDYLLNATNCMEGN